MSANNQFFNDLTKIRIRLLQKCDLFFSYWPRLISLYVVFLKSFSLFKKNEEINYSCVLFFRKTLFSFNRPTI